MEFCLEEGKALEEFLQDIRLLYNTEVEIFEL